ncbi:GNAT family N-acetyltransferase [Halapricum hydrolyticum]|uniref:GNAT family N-acetyltransferase n=1 Tax=Halapricum hydrolyticum TaxID=2979991 RepID=A0AAE3IAY2_9EURY|nr:GNAT family N-acetyltransferase [Halapricum hydrolyticum]MCU4717714.1 GNAT family N-acetyltransferase [Halapricum hydrolyticum]MCU4726757.1 GNAT family N-acetyltransferase [Halapricum hydrolyticum]
MVHVRTAKPEEIDALLAILDAAILETDRDAVRQSGSDGRTLVAVEDGRVLGAAVTLPAERGVRLDAIAVRKRRQGQGIGTALVERLIDRHGRVVAEFDERVRPFYESLGFEIRERESGRYHGVRTV